jgi:3-oxoacyl-[acyl-carrier protein] reductase
MLDNSVYKVVVDYTPSEGDKATLLYAHSLAPGPIETAMFRTIRPVGSEAEKELLTCIPMDRIGQAMEVAAGIEFLLSMDASFITGQTLCIDGGGSL